MCWSRNPLFQRTPTETPCLRLQKVWLKQWFKVHYKWYFKIPARDPLEGGCACVCATNTKSIYFIVYLGISLNWNQYDRYDLPHCWKRSLILYAIGVPAVHKGFHIWLLINQKGSSALLYCHVHWINSAARILFYLVLFIKAAYFHTAGHTTEKNWTRSYHSIFLAISSTVDDGVDVFKSI